MGPPNKPHNPFGRGKENEFPDINIMYVNRRPANTVLINEKATALILQ
jgi:hypothetical protein